ncbi:MAG: efflux RND transporter periplasmic adaptor subunit [Bacteroidales bacterium]
MFSALLGIVILALAACGSSKPPSSSEPSLADATTKAERRPFVRTIRVAGLVSAARSYSVAAPRLAGQGGMATLVVTRLVKSGATVKPGDLLVEFDRQSQMKNAQDKRAEYNDFLAQIRKKQADQAAAKASDESELKQAANAVEKARLERLKNEFLSAIEAEKNDQAYEEAQANLKQLKDTFDLKRRAAVAELRILEIQRDRAKAAMANSESNAEKLTVTSPIAGLAVPKQVFKGGAMRMGQVQEGEEVRPGLPIVEVVDASSMLVRAKVNQADFSYLEPGQPCEVRLDAYPGKVFKAHLEYIGPIGTTSDMAPKVRTFAVVFAIEGSDPTLMPDLSASVDVEIERTDGAVVVPRDAVGYREGKPFVMVRNGSSFAARTITIRASSESEVAVASGLDAGAVVRRGIAGT